jgi:polyisoprenoid-binding protein YceI
MKTLLLALLAVYSLFITNLNPDTKKYSYALDTEKSVVEWHGASPGASHQGSFGVISQGMEVADGTIKGGSFVIPIASIKNFDLPKTIKPILLKHLKSSDFFNAALYPEATFTITRVEPLTYAAAGAVAGANVLVTGDFTMIGQTHSISFPANINLQGETLAVEATFKLDRTRWGMTYAADPALKNRHIYPEVDIHLKLAGIKNEG